MMFSYTRVLNSKSLAFLAMGTATLTLLRWSVRSNEPAALRRKLPSPRETLLPHVSPAQAAASAYPPDLLPGTRDVDTPYGVMRVYEWGPEDGRKVLLIHGDTTPGPILGPIACQLGERGCRVMIIGQSAHHIIRSVFPVFGLLLLFTLSFWHLLRQMRLHPHVAGVGTRLHAQLCISV